MAFTLDSIVPWGRSLREYQRMFSLSTADLSRPILGCADGPASFNAELNARGGKVISCDPIYAFSVDEIRRRIQQTSATVVAQAREHADSFVWTDEIPDAGSLGEYRVATMDRFLEDFARGLEAGRYIATELPRLAGVNERFRLAVCSHFLFLYTDHLTQQLHLVSIRRLLELAQEVRIFPVLDLRGIVSAYVKPVINALEASGFDARLEQVDYEFQRGGNQMLRILPKNESTG